MATAAGVVAAAGSAAAEGPAAGNPDNLPGAGGGGGSGYAAPTATAASLTSGDNRGNGRAAISWRYDTTLTLTTDGTDLLYGHSATLTAEVTSPAGGAPAGSVAFLDGDEPLGTLTLTDGRAVFHTPVLRPGSHSITARYEGAALYTPSSSPEPVAVTVGFSRPCLTGSQEGPLTVVAGESLCLGAGARQSGPVRIEPGGALAASGASFNGRFSAEGALALSLCGVRIDGAVTVRETVGPVILCEGGSVTGPVTLESNAGGTTLSGTTITGPLRCEGNRPAPELPGVIVQGPRFGQCR
ncbi:Ig-like domain-containing protein [Streptomyces sp. NBC_00190]|uniref:Ig-like domain-containing protein n=1 Tax=Streptomyces sp. NBC_00190 TaxID=2903634 RepID=UPI002E2B03C5|nr:Ig-like domain-containing protein [Streptomyces sp. NBC_00190]